VLLAVDTAESLVPIAWPCSWWGLPGRPCHHGRRWSLTPPFHHHRGVSDSHTSRQGEAPRLSAFLWPFSVRSPRPGITQHHALWSPDFPRPVLGTRPPVRLGQSRIW